MSADEEPQPMTRDLMAKVAATARHAAERNAGYPEPEPRVPDEAAVAAARRRTAEGWVRARFRDARLTDDPEHAEALTAWAADPWGRNVVLIGPVGAGKSHLAAAAVMEAYALHGEPARFRWTNTAALMRRSLPDAPDDGGPSVLACRRSPMAVLDDVGKEKATDYTLTTLWMLLEDRWGDELPTVATSNLAVGPDGPLCQAIGEASYSRLVGSGALVLTVTGKDRRRARA